MLPMQLGRGHGALIEIFPDSTVETIWSSSNESIFGLAMRNDHVLFTTDSNGRIFDLDAKPNSDKLTILTETHESLATRLFWSQARTSTPPPAMWPNCSALGLPLPHEGTYRIAR